MLSVYYAGDTDIEIELDRKVSEMVIGSNVYLFNLSSETMLTLETKLK